MGALESEVPRVADSAFAGVVEAMLSVKSRIKGLRSDAGIREVEHKKMAEGETRSKKTKLRLSLSDQSVGVSKSTWSRNVASRV